MIETLININVILILGAIFGGGYLLGIITSGKILVKRIAHEMVDHIEQKIIAEDDVTNG